MDDKGNSLRRRLCGHEVAAQTAFLRIVGLWVVHRAIIRRARCAVLMNIDAPRRGVRLARGQCISIINTLGHRIPRRSVRREKERETGREREREKEKRKRMLVIPSRFFLSCDNYPLFSARVRQARRTISTDRTAQKQGEVGNKFKCDFCLIYSL